jgi:hypothetical protein
VGSVLVEAAAGCRVSPDRLEFIALFADAFAARQALTELHIKF